jgi:hypothetical protein
VRSIKSIGARRNGNISAVPPRVRNPLTPTTDETFATSAEIDFRGITPPLPPPSSQPARGLSLDALARSRESEVPEEHEGAEEDLPSPRSTQIYFTAPSPTSGPHEAATPIPVYLKPLGPSHHSIPSFDTWSNSEAQLRVPSRSHLFEEPMKDAFDSTLTGDITLMSRQESRNPFADLLHRSTPSYSGDVVTATGEFSTEKVDSAATRSVELEGLATAPYLNRPGRSSHSDVCIVGSSFGEGPSFKKPLTPAGFSTNEPDDPRWWEPLVQRPQDQFGLQIPVAVSGSGSNSTGNGWT